MGSPALPKAQGIRSDQDPDMLQVSLSLGGVLKGMDSEEQT